MSKTIPLQDFGIPIPTPLPAGTDHLIVYYGPTPLTPSYTQAARIDAGPVSALTVKTLPPTPGSTTAVTYWDDPISAELPGGLGNGSYDFVFTLMDTNGNESDFSPPITAAVDTTVPPTLGVPVLLGSSASSVGSPAAAAAVKKA
jgi:hypothetical protein